MKISLADYRNRNINPIQKNSPIHFGERQFSPQIIENLHKTANLYTETRDALNFFKSNTLSEIMQQYDYAEISQNKKAREIIFTIPNLLVKKIGIKIYRKENDKICEINLVEKNSLEPKTLVIKNFKELITNFDKNSKDYNPKTLKYATIDEIKQLKLEEYLIILRNCLEQFNKFVFNKI